MQKSDDDLLCFLLMTAATLACWVVIAVIVGNAAGRTLSNIIP